MKSFKSKFKKIVAGVMAAVLTLLSVNTGVLGGDGLKANAVTLSVENDWIFREANDAAAYSDRISGNTIFMDWNGTPLRGIMSKRLYSDYRMTAQIKKGSGSAWTSLQLGLPNDDRLDMWENLTGSALIGGTGLQVAISDTKATVGLVNGVENRDITQVEVALNGINTTSDFVDVEVTVKDDVYDITIGSQHIATVTPDKDSIQYGKMEVRRGWSNGVLVPVYAESDVAYYTSGKITANGQDTYFSDKAIAVVNASTGDGTFGFATRAEAFWVKDVAVEDLNASAGSSDSLDGVYYIKNAYSGKYLDVNAASAENGANVQQYAFNGSSAQQFKLVSDGSGYYSIMTGTTGFTKAVDVDNWSTDDGANIIQWEYHGGDCQKFQFDKAGSYYIIRTKVTGSAKCLDVEAVSKDDGANVHQWSVYGGAAQFWILEPVDGSSSGGENTDDNQGGTTDNNQGGTTDNNQGGTTDNNQGGSSDNNQGGSTGGNQGGSTGGNQGGSTGGNQGTTTAPSTLDGVYYIKNIYSGKYLDVAAASSESGANVHQYSYNGSSAQKFKLVSDGNGYYSIMTGTTNYTKAVDVADWNTSNGANIIQWDYHGGDCQKFQIEKVGNYYIIKTKITNGGKSLDIEGPSTADGANIHQWDVHGGTSQLWALEKEGSASGETTSITLNANLGVASDPPLLKKIEMYNAGCIQPLTNYDRDLYRITELNSTALRIDLSAGKVEGTAGKYLVGSSYSTYDHNGSSYKIDVNSLTYNFSQLDGIVKKLDSNGVLPYMSWGYIPVPLQENGDWTNLNTNISNWKEVWEEIYYQYTKHYVDSGIQIGYHEIYNEPDLEILKRWGIFDSSFVGFLDVDDFERGVFVDMYEYGAKGILRADPDATIGGPAYALGDYGVNDGAGFLSQVKSRQLPLDFYSFHTYLDGNTWYMSDGERASGAKNELEKVVDALAADPYYVKTSVHLNEYTWLNGENGANNGSKSAFNYYGAAGKTLDAIMEVVDRTSVDQVYWAQFMESTFGDDPYGLINKNGKIKAAYNAIKVYNDMPEWRYSASLSDTSKGLRTIVSSDDDKISILIWGSNNAEQEVDVVLNNAGFGSGVRRVYRIDSTHASYYDSTASMELVAEDVANVNTAGSVWTGSIPSNGVVYITINKNGKKDFTDYSDRVYFADYVKTQYYYEDRYRGLEGSREEYSDYVVGISGSYAYFDSTSNTMYLGAGDSTGLNGRYAGQSHASGAIICENIPTKFQVKVTTEGNISMKDVNTTLGFRVDFYDEASGTYTKSVYFHNGLYNAGRNPNRQDSKLNGLAEYPWGTERKADTVVQLSGDLWNIDLSKYAPAGWTSGTKVQISFDMQNTGANTRAQMELIK